MPYLQTRRCNPVTSIALCTIALVALLTPIQSDAYITPQRKSPLATKQFAMDGEHRNNQRRHRLYPNRYQNIIDANSHEAIASRSHVALMAQAPAAAAAAGAKITAAALRAITKLLSACGIGVWASRTGLLDQNALSVLSKLIFSVFQPCLLFVNVSSIVSKISDTPGGSSIYLLLVAAAFQIAVGFFVGKLMNLFIYRGEKNENSAQLLACTTFSNSGPLPLVFVDSLFRSHPDITLAPRGVAYISLYLLMWSPLFWIIAPGILGAGDAASKDMSPEGRAAARKKLIARIFSPPVLGSIFGMLVGYTPAVHKLLIGPTALLNPLFEAMRTLGSAYLPSVLLVLAGSLSGSASAAAVPTVESAGSATAASTTAQSQSTKDQGILAKFDENKSFIFQIAAIYFARFLLMPVLNFSMLNAARARFPIVQQIFEANPLLLFILLLETCMPSAQNTTVILQLQGKKAAAARLARVLMLVYVSGIPAMSFWLVKVLQTTGLSP